MTRISRVLAAIGGFDAPELERAASSLYDIGAYDGGSLEAALVAIATKTSLELAAASPRAIQLEWDQLLQFILQRFRLYRARKAHHPPWDGAGKRLYELAQDARLDLPKFQRAVHTSFFTGDSAIARRVMNG